MRYVDFDEPLPPDILTMDQDILAKARRVPAVDIVETQTQVNVFVDLPGLTIEDVNVELRSGDLWISGNYHPAGAGWWGNPEQQEGEVYLQVERPFGRFRRVVPLPRTISEDGIAASLESGVLRIAVLKSPEATVRKITISQNQHIAP